MRTKKKLKNMKNCRVKSRDLIRSVTKNSDDYDEKHMKMKFNSNDKLPLNKMTEIPNMIIAVRTNFHENSKYYRTVFLDDCLYKL